MKLKYYLRGLGLGIVVTTLILVIANNMSKDISDEEIIRRAKQLGMVMADDENLFDEDATTTAESDTKEPTTKEPTTKEPTTEEATTEEPTTEEPTIEEPTTEEATTEEPTTEEPTTEEPTTEEPTTEAPDYVELTFVIQSGMYSEAVTRILVQNGVITDEVGFNEYLSSTGYDEMIQTGSFTVNSSMSYEEIAKIISRTK